MSSDPPFNRRRVVLAVAFDIEGDTSDAWLAGYLTDYLNADEVNGLPIEIVPASLVVVAADEHGSYPVPTDD